MLVESKDPQQEDDHQHPHDDPPDSSLQCSRSGDLGDAVRNQVIERYAQDQARDEAHCDLHATVRELDCALYPHPKARSG